jgi:hypothetical protein
MFFREIVAALRPASLIEINCRRGKSSMHEEDRQRTVRHDVAGKAAEYDFAQTVMAVPHAPAGATASLRST